MIRLSVVTVCFNNYEGLEMTSANVFDEREGLDIEYIVIDGASKDGSEEYLKRNSDNIDLIVSEPDAGLYDAMNKGVNAASGDYLMFMNAGDKFSRGALHRIVNDLADQDLVFYRTSITAENGRTWLYPGPSISQLNIATWLNRYGPNLQSCGFSRAFYKNTRFDLNFRISADMIYIGKAIQTGRWEFFDYVSGQFYLGGVSNTYVSFVDVLRHAREASLVNLEYFRDGRSNLHVRSSAYARLVSKYVLLKLFGKKVARQVSRQLSR